jgi:hypothetical protein
VDLEIDQPEVILPGEVSTTITLSDLSSDLFSMFLSNISFSSP